VDDCAARADPGADSVAASVAMRTRSSTATVRHDEARRVAVRKARERMRRSDVYKRCVLTLSHICMLTGYQRPTASAAGWGMQFKATMPGDPAASAAARKIEVADQLREAFCAAHPLDEAQSTLPDDLRAAADWVCSRKGQDIGALRDERFACIRRCACDLEGWSTELGEHSPEWITSSLHPRPHYALFSCLGDVMGLPDECLVEDLVCGAPCVGDCPDSGCFRKCERPSAVEMDDLDHGAWNREVRSALERAGRDPSRRADLLELHDATQKEVEAGFATRIGTLEEVDLLFHNAPDAWRTMLRFGVRQACKLRPCDNARASLHNLATSLHEALVVETPDLPAKLASLFVELLGDTAGFSILMGTEDVASAYRKMPCSQPWFTIFAQWDPHTEQVVFYRLEGFNFGLSSAVGETRRRDALRPSVQAVAHLTRLAPLVRSRAPSGVQQALVLHHARGGPAAAAVLLKLLRRLLRRGAVLRSRRTAAAARPGRAAPRPVCGRALGRGQVEGAGLASRLPRRAQRLLPLPPDV
jgi:hypothetical protein